MDGKPITRWLEKKKGALNRVKYPLLILALGALFLMLPGKSSREAKSEAPAVQVSSDPVAECEVSLEEILSQIQGAGSVRVMLTAKAGEQTVYEKDRDGSVDPSDQGDSTREENSTVLVSQGSGTEIAVVSRVISPVYQGAIVVCGGGDDPKVRLAVVEAVCSVTGLGADQVTVLKMK